MICIRRCPNLFHYQLTMKQMMLFMECMMMYYHQFSNSNNFYCLSEVQGASSWDSIRVRFQVAVLLQHGHGFKNRGTNRKKIPPGKLACPPKRGQLPLIPYNFSCPIHQKKNGSFSITNSMRSLSVSPGNKRWSLTDFQTSTKTLEV